MNYYSLNQVINLCEAIAGSHQQIKQFGFGENFDISTEQQNYPLMWASVGPSTIAGKTLSLGMVILILDIVSDDGRNDKDILSDTLSISQDIVSMLKDPALQDDFTISDNITIEPLFEAFPDVVNGWRIDFTVDLAFESNRCQIPFNGNVFPPVVPDCPASIVLLNGGAFLTVTSGGTANVELLDENGAPVIPVSVVGSTITVPNGGGGGDVAIERTDTTDIAIVTAPAIYTVPDSDVVLKDSADNVLRTVSVMADSSEDETIGDVTVQLKDSTGANIGGVNNYLAESANNLTAPDATAVIKDSANNTLQSVNIPSNASQNVSVGNTIVQLKDSAGNNIGAPDSYLAESTNNKTAPDGNITLKRSNAATLRSVSVRSNQSKDETIADTTVQLKDSAGANIGAVNNYLAESSNNLTAPDASVQLKDSAGNNIGSPDSYKSNSSNNKTAPDGVASLRDSANNVISTTNIRSNATQNITAPDATANLRDSASNLISSTGIRSNASANITAPDGVANLVDSASNPLSSTNVRSNGSVNITAPNATVTLNGNAFLSPRSGQTIAATLTDEDNTQIPYTQVSNQVKVDMYLYVDPFWETVRDLTLTGNYNNLIL